MRRAVLMIAIIAILVTVIPISTNATEQDLYNFIYDSVLSYEEEIDISGYNITYIELYPLLEKMLKNEPMLFFWKGQYSFYFNSSTGVVLSILPEYTMSASEVGEALEYIESELQKIIDSIPEGIDEMQTALYLHDYICLRFKYDTTFTSSDIYTSLKTGKAVCMGYSLLYDELLTRVGIENRAAVSPPLALNHMWNQLYLDGSWYYVDVTWDDPMPDRFGRAKHTNFIQSDEAFAKSHDGFYKSENKSTNTKYDDYSWHKVTTPLVTANGKNYAVFVNQIREIDIHTDKQSIVLEVAGSGWLATNGVYLGFCVGLGSYKDIVYYNTKTEILAFDPKTNTVETFLTPDSALGTVMGLYTVGSELHYLMSKQGSFDDGVEYVIDIENRGEVNPPVDNPADSDSNVGGDANGDGKLDQFDYIYVKRTYFGTLSLNSEQYNRCDVNKDGTVNQYDYVLIKRAYFGTYVFN